MTFSCGSFNRPEPNSSAKTPKKTRFNVSRGVRLPSAAAAPSRPAPTQRFARRRTRLACAGVAPRATRPHFSSAPPSNHGTGTSENRSESGVSSGDVVAYGGPTDLWGASLTPSVVNAPGFRAALRAQYQNGAGNSTAHIDHLQVTIHTLESCP